MSLNHSGYALSRRYIILCIAFIFFLSLNRWKAVGQCELTVSSTDGYDVNLVLDPVEIQSPMSCPNGYNFKVRIEHDIDFGGSNPPSSLWTLQGNIDCGSIQDIFFDLPNAGGSGFVLSSNAWNPASNCATATPESLDCSIMEITIQGPGIPYQTISCNVVLPIQLLRFEGYKMNETVVLQWATAEEIQNDYFTVECSKNGYEWDIVNRVHSRADSMASAEYEIIDPDPYDGTSYYRLKQTDIDGQSNYSDIITIQFEEQHDPVEAYPNPASRHITITNGQQIQGILDFMGDDCTADVRIERKENSNVIMDVSTLPAGIYFIRTDQTVEKVYILSP